MTIVERSLQVSVFSTIGGIGAAISLTWMATHGGVELGLSLKSARTIASVVTAGGFPAAVLSWLFEKYGWRYSIFQGWLVKVPDLTGIWQGESVSDYFKDPKTGEPSRVRMQATIDHRFDDIIYSQEGRAKSVVLAADLVCSRGTWQLIVTYDNYSQDPDLGKKERSPALAENSREHLGTHVLTLSHPPGENRVSKSWALDGKYWSNKERVRNKGDRGTTGTLHLGWDQKLPRPKRFGWRKTTNNSGRVVEGS